MNDGFLTGQVEFFNNEVNSLRILVYPCAYGNDVLIVSRIIKDASTRFILIFTFKRSSAISMIFLLTKLFLPNILMHLTACD